MLLQNRGVSFSLDPAAVNPLTPGRRPFTTLNPPFATLDDGRTIAEGPPGRVRDDLAVIEAYLGPAAHRAAAE